jgi:RNase P subunit RPR2
MKELNQNTKVWRCDSCSAILGFVEGGETVRIKRKDLYVQVCGGKVMTNCYRCGKNNVLEYRSEITVKGGNENGL